MTNAQYSKDGFTFTDIKKGVMKKSFNEERQHYEFEYQENGKYEKTKKAKITQKEREIITKYMKLSNLQEYVVNKNVDKEKTYKKGLKKFTTNNLEQIFKLKNKKLSSYTKEMGSYKKSVENAPTDYIIRKTMVV